MLNLALAFLLAAESAAPSQVETFVKVTDAASRASDRWLFFAALFLLLLFNAGVIRYLLKDKESARADYTAAIKEAYAQASQARQEHAATMREMYGEQTKLAAELLIALQQNRDILAQVKAALERMK